MAAKGAIAAGIALVLLAGGCGGETDEERLTRLDAALRDVRAEVRAAREQVATLERAEENARSELVAARERLSEAEGRLAEREAEVDLTGTDEVLFRVIQRRLLEAEDLSGTAIQVHVARGVVTLNGKVPDEGARDAAVEVARGVPGVAAVESELRIGE